MNLKETDFQSLSLPELRKRWTQTWGTEPHNRIGRKMLERSLLFKIREQSGHGPTPEQQKRLDKLIASYKRNPNCFDQGHASLKPGMRLVRKWQNKAHTVTVTAAGFEYEGRDYSSLSTIASEITGSRWNGWLFFGLKKETRKQRVTAHGQMA